MDFGWHFFFNSQFYMQGWSRKLNSVDTLHSFKHKLNYFIKTLNFSWWHWSFQSSEVKNQSKKVSHCHAKSGKGSGITWISSMIWILHIKFEFEINVLNVKKTVKLLMLRLINFLTTLFKRQPLFRVFWDFPYLKNSIKDENEGILIIIFCQTCIITQFLVFETLFTLQYWMNDVIQTSTWCSTSSSKQWKFCHVKYATAIVFCLDDAKYAIAIIPAIGASQWLKSWWHLSSYLYLIYNASFQLQNEGFSFGVCYIHHKLKKLFGSTKILSITITIIYECIDFNNKNQQEDI